MSSQAKAGTGSEVPPDRIRGRRVLGPVHSHVVHLGEWVSGGVADALHGLLYRTGLLTKVPKWRAVAEPRAVLPLRAAMVDDDAVPVEARLHARVAVVAPGMDPPSWARGTGVAAMGGPALWIEDPRTGLTMAFELESNLLEALEPGASVATLPGPLRSMLDELGVLVPTGADEVESELEAMAATLSEEGFVVIPNLVSRGLLRALAEHYAKLPQQIRLEPDPYCGRLVEKNESVARHLHEGYRGFMEKLARRPVRPSYCYAMWYAPGARLRVHRDNPLCEYTLNLIVDQVPASSTHWPLCIVSRRGRVEEIYVRPGDAVLFQGRELAHFRRRLQGKGGAIGVLFHYVDAEAEVDLAAAGAYD